MANYKVFWPALTVVFLALGELAKSPAQQPAADVANLAGYSISQAKVGPRDWPQWGGTSLRNNTPQGNNIATDWIVPIDGLEQQPKNVKWSAPLGSQTYGSPVVANGKVFVGTNNGGARLARYPRTVDLGCLLCFEERSGRFLWQHSNEKLPPGRGNDETMMGVHSVPCVDGNRLWYVTNRSEVVCLDTEGFDDGENDGPFTAEEVVAAGEADVVWKFDLVGKLGVFPHDRATCCVTCVGDVLLVITSNGVDRSESRVPAPEAPSFVALDRNTAKLLWTDNTPGPNILNGQWSSPAYAVLGGKPQVLLAGGDGWLYSFDPRGDGSGKSRLWWKFDGNAKESKWLLAGRGVRNEIVAAPVVYDRRVYFGVGQDPDHGEGQGCLWCLDPTKRFDGGDVSAELVMTADGKPVPFRRGQAADQALGETVVPNPDSAVVWKYEMFDLDGDGAIVFDETMHRTCSPVAVKDDLLYVPDLSGLMHCLDARTGRPYWTHDLFAACNGWNIGPLVVDGKTYVTDEEGKVTVFRHDRVKKILAENDMGNSVYTTPTVANDVLFIASKLTLYAIAAEGER